MENSKWVLLFFALTLGLRHGFDLDHLSIVDSMVRTTRHHRYLSKCVGILFSLGHGLVVTIVSLMIGGGLFPSQIPVWLDLVGNWVSILFLIVFGVLTLISIFRNSVETLPLTIKGHLLRKIITKNSSPMYIMFIGALFAFSFDTFSQIALFSISASFLAGWLYSGILGIVFMFGMMMSDGLNGLLVSTLIQRADKTSRGISKIVGILVSFFSLTIGLLNLVKLNTP